MVIISNSANSMVVQLLLNLDIFIVSFVRMDESHFMLYLRIFTDLVDKSTQFYVIGKPCQICFAKKLTNPLNSTLKYSVMLIYISFY